jgi:hypothetical protein
MSGLESMIRNAFPRKLSMIVDCGLAGHRIEVQLSEGTGPALP